MSISGFSEFLRNDVQKPFEELLLKEYKKQYKTSRQFQNRNIHASLISKENLKKNLKINAEDIDGIFDAFVDSLFKYPNTIKINSKSAEYIRTRLGKNPSKVFVQTAGKDEYLLYARKYSNIQRAFAYISKNTQKFINTNIGARRGKTYDISGIDVGHTAGFGRDDAGTAAGLAMYKTLKSLSTKRFAGLFDGNVPVSKIQQIQNVINEEFKKVHSDYQASFSKEVSGNLGSFIKSDIKFIYVVPQEWELNQKILKSSEDKVIKNLVEYTLYGKGSKPLITMIDENISSVFHTGKGKKAKSKTKTSGKINDKRAKKKGKVITHDEPNPRLKDASGRFTSTLKIKDLLQPLISQLVKKDMDSANYFKTDTNRFTKSVKITDVVQANRTVLINYNYMQHPYRVFEAGGSHHRAGREPSSIIEKSIRQAAIKLIGRKFNVTPRLGMY